eukprot:scaffold217752_cov33-Prasinocladus_malaysianus.AAC.1
MVVILLFVFPRAQRTRERTAETAARRAMEAGNALKDARVAEAEAAEIVREVEEELREAKGLEEALRSQVGSTSTPTLMSRNLPTSHTCTSVYALEYIATHVFTHNHVASLVSRAERHRAGMHFPGAPPPRRLPTEAEISDLQRCCGEAQAAAEILQGDLRQANAKLKQ